MKNFNEYLEAAKKNIKTFKNANDFAKEIETTIKKYFPKSLINVKFTQSIKPSVNITFRVGANKSNWVNGIDHNDIAPMNALIYGVDKDGNLSEKLSFSPTGLGGFIVTKPEPESYNAQGRVKVGLRKKTGTPTQVLKHIDSYFSKLKTEIKSNKNNLQDSAKKLLKGII